MYYFLLVLYDSYVCLVALYFFFFKQKTAYEMRISDWSSDVCSSDLSNIRCPASRPASTICSTVMSGACRSTKVGSMRAPCRGPACCRICRPMHGRRISPQCCVAGRRIDSPRSEEHTSELQSLMRISYSVFCWQKK